MKTIIISLGGSLIVPDEIDVKFLRNFKKLIEGYTQKNSPSENFFAEYRFIIICGGGKIARRYQEAASDIIEVDNTDLDWIGVMATKLNAQLLKTVFGGYAEDRIVSNPTEKISFKKNILIASGWKPGWSTDYDAVLIAKQLKIKEIVNMSNIEHVYDNDPKKHKNAKPLKQVSWKDFRKIVGSQWSAGLNMPFDPIAAEEAEKLKLKVVVLGKDLKNLGDYLDGKGFEGSVVG